MTQAPLKLLSAIGADRHEARSLLFLWLTTEPTEAQEYVDVAARLLEVGEQNLAHLVIHKGLALLDDDDNLSLFALKLEIQRSELIPQVA